ncbi:uncharacterized protein [Asterias amurensis]|uniref:uncharacterized protein n=1 Tax=Asterias amurensis TaxID=7602 RepID=UPI003AB3F6CE
MELVAPSDGGNTDLKLSLDSLTEIAFSDEYTGGNMSSSEFAPAADLHAHDGNARQKDMTALDHVVNIMSQQAGTVTNDCSEQSVYFKTDTVTNDCGAEHNVFNFKTAVSVGVQVNLCCCATSMCTTPLSGAVKQDADIDTSTQGSDLKTENNENNVTEHTEEDQTICEQSDAVETVKGEDVHPVSIEKVVLKKRSSKGVKRKDKKRRKVEKASQKPKQIPKQKKQKVMIRRSTKSTLERRYLCEGCGIKFVHKATYDRHLLELRGQASEHECPKCKTKFSYLCKLKQHVAAKHPELTPSVTRERPVICHICGVKLQTNVSMNKHMRIHDGDKPFQCKYCPKAFRWHTGLEYHERIHTGERPYQCPNCPKGFTNPSDMARHQTVHTGKKPHLCHQCGKGFTQSGTLHTHIRNKHTPESGQVSNKTSKKVTKSRTSDIHVCHLCGRYFFNLYLLEAHVKKSHQQQLMANLEGGSIHCGTVEDMRCGTLEDMKLQLHPCPLGNPSPGFNLSTCIPTEREIAEVVVNMLAP